MKPLLAVTANIKVSSGNYLGSLPSGKISLSKVKPGVISPHILRGLAFCLFLLVIGAAHGSSVAVMVSGDAVLIGADGVETQSGRGFRKSVPFCKIRQQGPIVYTATGTYALPDGSFDLWDLAEVAIKNGRTIDGIYGVLEPRVLRHLPALVESGKVNDPENYAKWIRGIPVIAVSFASVERGTPIAGTIAFTIDSSGKPVMPTKRTQMGRRGQVQDALLGYNEEMKAATSAPNWGLSFARDPVRFTEQLIQREIAAATRDGRHDVGAPISIWLLTAISSGLVSGHEGACK